MNLLRLAGITNRTDFRQSAERTLSAFASRLLHVTGIDEALGIPASAAEATLATTR